jgi:class 3 adenylate cyclase
MSFLSDMPRRLRQLMGGGEMAEPPGSAYLATEPPPPGNGSAKFLVPAAGVSSPAARHQFFHQLEIGRNEEGRVAAPGQLLVDGSNISWRHCIITQNPEGHCFIRDLSRNGTRLNGRRLVPNMETEIRVGQKLDLGSGLEFVLEGEPVIDTTSPASPRRRTDVEPNLTVATVLVGDIRNYTVMVREAPAAELQQSVNRVFERLTAAVLQLGGTVKEFPGDAILAFWEGNFKGEQAVTACRAAVELDRLAREIATDPAVWTLSGYPLHMDWALATGDVVIDSFGGDTPIGLSMVGEPVVLACRLEKFANDQTGRILTCRMTRQMVAKASRFLAEAPPGFVDLGPMHAKGFDQPDQVFALQVPDS